MKVDAKAVKALRGKTGAGMMDCKKALVEAGGDEKKAIVILREKGLAAAARRAERVAAQGIIDSYIHLGGKIGVLLEVNCETDFVARNEEFREFVRNICLQVAASNPLYIGKEDVSAAELAKEREILRGQALREGKPEKVIERIVEGRINKYYQENCLLEQPYIRDPEQSVGDLLAALIAKIGENIVIRRFARFAVGEETGGDENPAN
ncbi:MAG: translation elongation factor Ts [Firmicutes bacterium]|nr:translation elongation factor Ts [Bacillota bacterium]